MDNLQNDGQVPSTNRVRGVSAPKIFPIKSLTSSSRSNSAPVDLRQASVHSVSTGSLSAHSSDGFDSDQTTGDQRACQLAFNPEIATHLLKEDKPAALLAGLCHSFPEAGMELIDWFIQREVGKQSAVDQIFRNDAEGDSLLKAIIGHGLELFWTELARIVKDLKWSRKGEDGARVANNIHHLGGAIDAILGALENSLELSGSWLMRRVMQQLDRTSQSKFGKTGRQALTTLLVLRKINPMLLTDPQFSDSSKVASGRGRVTKTMIVAKLLQILFNQQPSDDAVMEPLNPMITDYSEKIEQIMRKLCSASNPPSNSGAATVNAEIFSLLWKARWNALTWALNTTAVPYYALLTSQDGNGEVTPFISQSLTRWDHWLFRVLSGTGHVVSRMQFPEWDPHEPQASDVRAEHLLLAWTSKNKAMAQTVLQLVKVREWTSWDTFVWLYLVQGHQLEEWGYSIVYFDGAYLKALSGEDEVKRAITTVATGVKMGPLMRLRKDVVALAASAWADTYVH